MRFAIGRRIKLLAAAFRERVGLDDADPDPVLLAAVEKAARLTALAEDAAARATRADPKSRSTMLCRLTRLADLSVRRLRLDRHNTKQAPTCPTTWRAWWRAMTPAIPIAEALADANLLGAALGDVASWQTWRVVLKAAFAEPLTDEERALFALVAGDRAPPSRRVRELWCGPIGRRSGKSRMAAAVAVHVALLTDHSKRLVPGEIGTVAVIAASREQANTVFNYVRGFLMASPLLAGQVESIGRDEIMLHGDICISVVTNSFPDGARHDVAGGDWRRSFYWSDESSAQPDVETYRAVLPSLVASGGMWVGISTGYRRAGLLFQKHRDHFGRDGDDVLVRQRADRGVQSDDRPCADCQGARAGPGERRRRNGTAAFAVTLRRFCPTTTLMRRSIMTGRWSCGRVPGCATRAFADPCGGRHDAYCLAIGHFEGTRTDGRFVLDVVRGAQPPFDPQTTTRAFADLLQGIST